MSTETTTNVIPWLGQKVGLIVGLSVTAMSMSSGFIWASQGKVALVYVAGFFSWTGYLFAHYAVTGAFVDDIGPPSEAAAVDTTSDRTSDEESKASNEGGRSLRGSIGEVRALAPADPIRAIGFVAGIAILVAGIAILAWYVRQENHLLGNLGSGTFLAGYVIAHYFDSGSPL